VIVIVLHHWLRGHPRANHDHAMELVDAALAYARRGHAIFPLAPRSKAPLISAANGGHGLHDATTDPDQIRQWWRAQPEANIGLRTGLAFDVIDLDSETAVDALDSARAGRERITGPVVATAHGFHHYVLPTGLGNRAGVLPGVDFRGRNAYVLAPPSQHPSGARYRWIIPGGLSPAPPWLLDLLQAQRPRDLPGQTQVLPPHLRDENRATAYGRTALRRGLERLAETPNGQRNDDLNRAAFSLGRLVASGALGESETVTALIEVGQKLGLGLRECERTVASGMNAGIRGPGGLEID
jgi:Bifunctional DNA primase/polymerase, N-terminal